MSPYYKKSYLKPAEADIVKPEIKLEVMYVKKHSLLERITLKYANKEISDENELFSVYHLHMKTIDHIYVEFNRQSRTLKTMMVANKKYE
jgi:hypothetical protein